MKTQGHFGRSVRVALMSLMSASIAAVVSPAFAQVGKNSPDEYWWYWDRPASQLPVPAPGIGVALVVAHVFLSGDQVARVPRRSPLPLPASAVVIPVVHVEVDPARPFAGTARQLKTLRDAVLDAAQRGSPSWVQLDFEARKSQREFWRSAVEAVRGGLPAGVRLSVTALASWCHGDRWLADVPADEVVPMYFRLGRDRPDYVVRSAAGVTEPKCASAHGLADDEPAWPVALPGRRYVFLGKSPRPRATSPDIESTP